MSDEYKFKPEDFSKARVELEVYSKIIDYIFKIVERSFIAGAIYVLCKKTNSPLYILFGAFLCSLILCDIFIKVFTNTMNIPYENKKFSLFGKYGKIFQAFIMCFSAIIVMIEGAKLLTYVVKIPYLIN